MIATGAVSTAIDTSSPQLPAKLVEQLRAALDRLNPEGGKIGLAVSGGPDSMAMLVLAHAAIPGRFAAATVNHGIRAEAVDECALVVAACEARGIACAVLSVEVGEGNLQERAREARYAALGKWAAENGLSAIATAHHADDQAETLLMRLNRGSGVTGLAGIRERVEMDGQGGAPVIRPLLHMTRDELRACVDSAGVPYCTDPSNTDPRFDRVRLRQALEAADWLDPRAIARSATFLDDADNALVWACDLVWDQYVVRSAEMVRFHPAGPKAIRLRVLGRAIDCLGGTARGGDVARLLDRLERGESGNVAGVLAAVEGDDWIFRPEPPRRTG